MSVALSNVDSAGIIREMPHTKVLYTKYTLKHHQDK